MELMTRKHEKIISFFKSLNQISDSLEKLKGIDSVLNGERYLTDKQLSLKLNISRRTLQDYRTQGIISYIHLGGKILYRESDIEKLLENAYLKAYKETLNDEPIKITHYDR